LLDVGVGIHWLDRGEEQWRETLGSEEEYHPTASRPLDFVPSYR
jgi:hypothetical protein